MTKILHVLGKMNRGGIETFIMNLYRNIDRDKIQFDFLLASEDGDYTKEIEKLGGKIYATPPRNKGYFKKILSLISFFSKHRYSTIHVHASSLSPIEPLIVAKFFGVKKRIMHSHSSSQKAIIHKMLHFINKPIIRFAATDYFGCSDLANRWMFQWTGVYNSAITINNGINTSVFSYNTDIRSHIRESLNIDTHITLFGHVGRFTKVKNHPFIVRVFNDYLKINCDSHLILIGAGDDMNNIKELVEEFGISDKVSFLGIREDIADLLQAIDIFLFPSFYEGLPVSLVEAQTSGVMIYGSDKISTDVILADNIKFISLDHDERYWAEYIYNDYIQYVRCDKSTIIKEKGFDIGTTADYLVRHIYHSYE